MEVIDPSPARKKLKRDWTEAPFPTKSSFAMNTTAPTKDGRPQTSIDPIEYTKYGVPMITHAVRVSAAQSRSWLHDLHRILSWIKRMMYYGSTHELTSLTKLIHAVERQPGFVEDLRTPFLLPLRAEVVWGPVK